MSERMDEKQRKLNQQFLEMYESFSDEIFRFCMSKTRNREVSLDITQETFVKTWDYLRGGKTIDMARPFLYRAARNQMIDYARKKQALSLDTMFDDEHGMDVPDTKFTPSGDRLDRSMMLEKLKALPEHHYEILVLRFIQELTLAEIAKMYKESENTVSVKIHRAIKQAQKMFPESLDDSDENPIYES